MLFLVIAACLLLLIALQKQYAKITKWLLFVIFFCFLFLSFKEGFVRHDIHALIATHSLLMATLLFPFVFSSYFIYPLLLLAVMTLSFITHHYMRHQPPSAHLTPGNIVRTIITTYSNGWHVLHNPIKHVDQLAQQSVKMIEKIKEQAHFPVLSGTTDIYSYDQAYLISSGNQWNPRPMFQGYSAYTAKLIEMNRQHLLGPQAPNNIIFKVQPIDRRYPSLADGASWPILLWSYQPIDELSHHFLLLGKKANQNIKPAPLLPILSKTYKLGEQIPLPKDNQIIFAKITVNPSLLGKIANALFKPSALHISITLQNGQIEHYRFIAGMASSGFILSPLVETTNEFAQLYGNAAKLIHKQVKSFSIEQNKPFLHLWQQSYNIVFYLLNTQAS